MGRRDGQWHYSWAGKVCASSLAAVLLGSWWQAHRDRRAARRKRRG